MAVTRLEFVKGGSQKFWEVSTAGPNLVVRFGRLRTDGQTKSRKCDSPAAAKAEEAKLTAEKLKKGYVATNSGAKAAKAAPVAKAAKTTKAAKAARAGNAPVAGEVARIRKRLEAVVPAWFDADQQLGRSIASNNGDDNRADDATSIEQDLGTPCSAAEIAGLEKHLGKPLPASYRAYLSLYGKGEKTFGSPLGPKEQRSKSIAQAIRWKSGLFDEFQDTNPFTAGAIPFVLDGDSRSMVLFVPPIGKTRDMAVVAYDITEEEDRYRDLETYLRQETKTALEIVAKHAKQKKRGGIRSQRDAIDAVLASSVPSKSALKTIALRLKGKLQDGWVPAEATIMDLKDRAESERFVARLRAIPTLLKETALSLADGAIELIGDKDERAKALPVVELLFDSAPKKLKAGDRTHDLWLETLNSGIHRAYAAKDYALAARLADLALPHVRASEMIPHNAACAYVAVKRFDDAMKMCRVAVETKYAHLDRLRTDKDLGPLLRRADFKALFA